MQDWSSSDIYRLRKYYNQESMGALMDRLDKTEEEIFSQAAKMKLVIRRASTGGIITEPRPGVLVHRMV